MEKESLWDLKEVVSRKTGLRILEQDTDAIRKVVQDRIRFHKLHSQVKYIQFLESNTAESRREHTELLSLLTVSESYFFRDKGQFVLLKERLLPELIERNKEKQKIRIWSAGCSTGEEPYSLAMLIDELLPRREEWKITITGTDISEEFLKKAKTGIYGQWSFRMVEPEIRERYFRKRRNEWEIDERIKRMVSFSSGNLLHDHFPDHIICNMDLILCRNVFIYFRSEAIPPVVNKFINTLNEGGYLITGHGEMHLHSYRNLKARIFPQSVVYQKIVDRELRIAATKPEIPETKIKTIKIARTTKPKTYAEVTGSASPVPKSELELAREYANKGEYDKAEVICKKAIKVGPYPAKFCFILSQIAESRYKSEDAKSLLKKAIYLDPSFIAAYIELATYYDKEGNAERARKMRDTAAELVKQLPKDAIVEPYDISAVELIEYLRKPAE